MRVVRYTIGGCLKSALLLRFTTLLFRLTIKVFWSSTATHNPNSIQGKERMESFSTRVTPIFTICVIRSRSHCYAQVTSRVADAQLAVSPSPSRGHVADITAGSWHPRQSDEFITSSNDSTIRIWDTADRMKQKTVIVAKSKERGGRTKVTACAYSFDAKTIAGGMHICSFPRP